MWANPNPVNIVTFPAGQGPIVSSDTGAPQSTYFLESN